MIRSLTDSRMRAAIIGALALIAVPAQARAQGIGAGPLTVSLTASEPQTGVLRIGPARIAPGVVVREAGWDSNIFQEAVNPKEDYVVAVAPDAAVFLRLPLLQISAYGGGDFNWYNTYESENSTGYSVKGRLDFLFSRVRPFAGGARKKIRERPNGEIDVRANRIEDEWSGGVAYELSIQNALYVSAYQTTVRYLDAFEQGVDLSATLDHDTRDYSAGLRTDLTPLAQLTLSGSYQEDTFSNDNLRNGDTRLATALLRIAPEAIVSGTGSVSFEDYQPQSPLVKPFRGLTATGSLTYSFLEVGRLTFTGNRSTEYSFDSAEAYYVENSATLYYTHRFFGAVDGQVRGGRSVFDYSYSETTPAHKDTLDTVGGSVGYNLSNRTRISANYEFARRRSPVLPDRNYDRRRVYVSWTFAQ